MSRYKVLIKEAGKPYIELSDYGSSSPARIEKDIRVYEYPDKNIQEIKIREIKRK